MITEVYLPLDEEAYEKGINIKINRIKGVRYVTMTIENNFGESILPDPFDVNFDDLKLAIAKLELE